MQGSDTSNIGLIGHSRGGALSIIYAANDARIKALSTWAAVSTLDYAWNNEKIAKWEKEDVYYIINGRTGQQMPMYFQMYQDFSAKKDLFDVASTLAQFDKPFLIVHGAADPVIPVAAAEQLKQWAPNASLHLIEDADHVFNGRHPYTATSLSAAAMELTKQTLTFFKYHLMQQ